MDLKRAISRTETVARRGGLTSDQRDALVTVVAAAKKQLPSAPPVLRDHLHLWLSRDGWRINYDHTGQRQTEATVKEWGRLSTGYGDQWTIVKVPV